jgi:formylglycine-generating enzyme required for sulfatase activity
MTAPVGTYKPNAFGLYDMMGNVWEWCGDWYKSTYYYESQTKEIPQGPERGEYRVLRGGAWDSQLSEYVRASKRNSGKPDDRKNYYGVRLVSPAQ